MAHVERLRVYPVKSLAGTDREAVGFAPGGGLAGDREFALFDADGGVINGKRSDAVHRLRTTYDPESETLTVGHDGVDDRWRFDLATEVAAAEDWFGSFFDQPVALRRRSEQGFVDRPQAGPSVVSTATLETVASWFDELAVDGVRRRVRANVEIGGVPAFWEDRFVGPDAPAFLVGENEVRFEGVEACGRCVVPTRDPDTGEATPDFRQRFIERRAATFPDFADRDAFQHDYTLMLIAQVPEADRNGRLRVGAAVRVTDEPG